MAQQQTVYLDDNGEPIQQPNEVSVTIRGEGGGYLDPQGNLVNAPLPDAAFRQQAPSVAQSEGGGGWGEYLAGAMPSIGGMVGSIAGGGIGGATVGGMAGAGYEQLLKHAGELPGAMRDIASNLTTQPRATFQGFLQGAREGAENAATAGVIQGAGEAIGRPVSKALYGVAMRPLQAVRQKYGLGKLIDTGYENRIMPTKAGAAKAGKLVDQSRDAQNAMAATYDARGGAPLSIMKAAQVGHAGDIALADTAQRFGGAGGQVANQIGEQVSNVMKANPGGSLSAVEMMAAKRSQDAIADPAIAASMKPGAPPVARGSEPWVAKGWSRGYRGTLNDALGPEFAAQGQATKTAFGVQRMADYASERPEMLANIVGGAASVPQAWEDPMQAAKTFMLYRALIDPRSLAALSFAGPNLVRGVDAASGGVATDLLRQALLSQLQEEQ